MPITMKIINTITLLGVLMAIMGVLINTIGENNSNYKICNIGMWIIKISVIITPLSLFAGFLWFIWTF